MFRFSKESPERLPTTHSPEEDAYIDALHSAIASVEQWRSEGNSHFKEERKRDALALVSAAEKTVGELSSSTVAWNALEKLRAELEGREPRHYDGATDALVDHLRE